jgi:hypothetical protein
VEYLQPAEEACNTPCWRDAAHQQGKNVMGYLRWSVAACSSRPWTLALLLQRRDGSSPCRCSRCCCYWLCRARCCLADQVGGVLCAPSHVAAALDRAGPECVWMHVSESMCECLNVYIVHVPYAIQASWSGTSVSATKSMREGGTRCNLQGQPFQAFPSTHIIS